MVRVKSGNIYIITSYSYEDAHKFFLSLYRRTLLPKVYIRSTDPLKKIMKYNILKVQGNSLANFIDSTMAVADIINDVVAEMEKKEPVKRRIENLKSLIFPESFQYEVAHLIISMMLRRVLAAVFIDRPEVRMMPVEQVLFRKVIEKAHKKLDNRLTSVVILTTSSYMIMPRVARVFFVYREWKKLRYETKPLKAFAVADLML